MKAKHKNLQLHCVKNLRNLIRNNLFCCKSQISAAALQKFFNNILDISWKIFASPRSKFEIFATKNYCVLGSKGVAALPTIIIVSMIILVVGLSISSSGFIEGLGSFGELESKKSLFIAEAGAMDAFKRISRNVNCNIGGSPDCSNYSLAADGATTTVSVSGTNIKTIISIGQVGFKKSKIQLIVSIDAGGKITQTSWQQLTN